MSEEFCGYKQSLQLSFCQSPLAIIMCEFENALQVYVNANHEGLGCVLLVMHRACWVNVFVDEGENV
jgi:hypothetical protein